MDTVPFPRIAPAKAPFQHGSRPKNGKTRTAKKCMTPQSCTAAFATRFSICPRLGLFLDNFLPCLRIYTDVQVLRIIGVEKESLHHFVVSLRAVRHGD